MGNHTGWKKSELVSARKGGIALARKKIRRGPYVPKDTKDMEDLMSPFIKSYGVVVPVLGMFLLVAGCHSAPYSAKGTRIHTVNIGPKIEPLQINAGRGDEVRWVNQRSEPIAVVFPKTDAVPT